MPPERRVDMDRKKAIVAAATVAGSLLAASSAYALTSGIVGSGRGDGAGDLNPVLDVAPTGASAATTLTTDESSDAIDEDVSADTDDAGTAAADAGSDDGVVEPDDSVVEHEDVHSVEPPEVEGRTDDD